MKTTTSHFSDMPHTKPGWWAIGLAGLFIVLFIFNSAVLMQPADPFHISQPVRIAYGFVMLLSGLASGVIGLVAVIRAHERSWLVWLTILPGLMMLFLIIGELLSALFFPH
jgi:hypothetical protein